jgi:hypothetical protein
MVFIISVTYSITASAWAVLGARGRCFASIAVTDAVATGAQTVLGTIGYSFPPEGIAITVPADSFAVLGAGRGSLKIAVADGVPTGAGAILRTVIYIFSALASPVSAYCPTAASSFMVTSTATTAVSEQKAENKEYRNPVATVFHCGCRFHCPSCFHAKICQAQ